ncbi:MAG TPA: DinB family protein [Gemmatimonadaceae bacterium]|nr:DinB family protein [Gemmatimonadaceae bacterium]
MQTLTPPLIAEVEQEASSTRRVLERVPEDMMSWKPHPRSMSLGQLARHIAVIPGALAEFFDAPQREVPTVPLPEARSRAELLGLLDESVAAATRTLGRWGDAELADPFIMTLNSAVIYQAPRMDAVRAIMFNHLYHHRGQLVLYLRLLGVPVPGVYGPSADEKQN